MITRPSLTLILLMPYFDLPRLGYEQPEHRGSHEFWGLNRQLAYHLPPTKRSGLSSVRNIGNKGPSRTMPVPDLFQDSRAIRVWHDKRGV